MDKDGRVVILGDKGCGKTVFLTLLYEAQIEYTMDTRGDFRFYAEPELTMVMGMASNSMRMGIWPDDRVKKSIEGKWILLGFRNSLTGYTTIKLMLSSGLEGDDELMEYDNILNSDMFVFLIDVSKMGSEPKSDVYRSMMKYDDFVAKFLKRIGEYKYRRKETKKSIQIYPVFVFTKFDTINPKVLSSLGLKSKPPSPLIKKNWDKRIKYAEKLLKEFYPETFSFKYRNKLINTYFNKAGYFFSCVRTEISEDGEIIPKLKLREGSGGTSYEIDFSKEEYKGFIEYIREMLV